MFYLFLTLCIDPGYEQCEIFADMHEFPTQEACELHVRSGAAEFLERGFYVKYQCLYDSTRRKTL